jgi:hypothetical protein
MPFSWLPDAIAAAAARIDADTDPAGAVAQSRMALNEHLQPDMAVCSAASDTD